LDLPNCKGGEWAKVEDGDEVRVEVGIVIGIEVGGVEVEIILCFEHT